MFPGTRVATAVSEAFSEWLSQQHFHALSGSGDVDTLPPQCAILMQF